ncbi:MAG: hypothetical protein J7L43_00285 [Candidatus Aenigmarchaeota archaeon]|nr:hypothetical protein [Candidatus Aenigmarchaeota archaeon]
MRNSLWQFTNSIKPMKVMIFSSFITTTGMNLEALSSYLTNSGRSIQIMKFWTTKLF